MTALRAQLLLGVREHIAVPVSPWHRPQRIRVSGLLPGNVYHQETVYIGSEDAWRTTQAKYLKVNRMDMLA